MNYPVHEKELLAIIWALGKWRTDLLGFPFEVWTDHKTLEHFSTQQDLSWQQAWWMEFLSQYDTTIHYLLGEKNTVADALSQLPDPNIVVVAAIFSKTQDRKIHSWFKLEDTILDEIKQGYLTDTFVTKLTSAAASMKNIEQRQGFWFIDDQLVVPNGCNVHETLFHITHDKLGHFGTIKTYEALRGSFYWPNMHRDLKEAYIPSCADCQWNKSTTTKPIGPLHPLPVPNCRCDSIAIDFIGPLPPDEGFDSIITFTDRLGLDIQIVPTSTTLTAKGLVELFFANWYCENGLPLDIVSDQDKLFISKFWHALHKLTGVKLKMSTSYHPQTDSSSKQTNKTVIQCIRFVVECNQRGWSCILPKVCFNIMNTINASTGYSPFHLHFRKSPHVLPPLLPHMDSEDEPRAAKFMPRFDGPYQITSTDENHSTVTLDMLQHTSLFLVFHTSEILPFKENDDRLFPH